MFPLLRKSKHQGFAQGCIRQQKPAYGFTYKVHRLRQRRLRHRFSLHSRLSAWLKGFEACSSASHGYRHSGRNTACKLCSQKFSTKTTFILFCVYGASSLAILYLVSSSIGFKEELIIPFLIINFFCGIQHGNTNTTPNIMIADCVDEIEYKTGKRQDGIAYAGYGLFQRLLPPAQRASAPGFFTHGAVISFQQTRMLPMPHRVIPLLTAC